MAELGYERLVGFGEAMLRLTSPTGETLVTATTLAAHVGGAELNGLIAATAYGMPTTWVSAVGDDTAGRRIVHHARASGVRPEVTIDTEARTGTYFVESAAYPRSTPVSYDRSGSAASRLGRGDVCWQDLLDARTCLYSTGITAGISATSRDALDEAVRHAHGVGATVALDVNYRSKLWPADEAYRWVATMLPTVDVLSVSDADLRMLGHADDDLVAARANLGVGALVVTAKTLAPYGATVRVRAVDADGESEASGTAAVVDPFGTGDAMFGAFLATYPALGRDAAVEHGLRAALIVYGLHGDALVADPSGPLDGGRIAR